MAAIALALVSSFALSGCGGGDAKKDAGKAAAPAAGGQKMVLRYAENQPKDYPTTAAARKFADIVKEKTNGRITVEVYDSAQLGDEKSVIEQIQFGSIDMSRVSLSPLSEFAKQLNVLQLPYLYRDGANMWKVLDGKIGQDLLATLDKSGIVGLTWFDAGARNFYTKNPAKSMKDLAGLKIRVQESSMMMDMVKAVGANPTPMAYGEVYSALQTGVIDGAENNWPSYESTRHFEVAKNYMLDEHNRVPEPMIISKKTMIAQLDSIAELSVVGNILGMLTDSRSFLSYTRHEYYRRILCNWIGNKVENGEYPADMKVLGQMVEDICYNNAAKYFGFGE